MDFHGERFFMRIENGKKARKKKKKKDLSTSMGSNSTIFLTPSSWGQQSSI